MIERLWGANLHVKYNKTPNMPSFDSSFEHIKVNLTRWNGFVFFHPLLSMLNLFVVEEISFWGCWNTRKDKKSSQGDRNRNDSVDDEEPSPAT
jgi:hypothetical protein